MKVAITIRTCLQYDGRVLAQLVTLANRYKDSTFEVFVFPNCKSEGINLPANVIVRDAQLWSMKLPGSAPFLLIKQLHFGLIMLFRLSSFKPDVIHVHDEFAILGPMLFKKWFNKKVKLIYDDHELYNLDANPSVYRKLRRFLEFKMFKSADTVIMANSHRAKYARLVVNELSHKEITIIDNYPFSFFQSQDKKVETFKKESGIKYALHQGVISEDRGKSLLKEVVKNLPDNWKVVLLGLPVDQFAAFVNEQKEYANRIVNGGRVPNDQIVAVYENFDASIIFYKTRNLNEKYCAPNRLYQAANAGLPLIVNDNPVLTDFVDKTKTGISIDRNKTELKSNTQRFFSEFVSFEINAAKLKNEFLYENKVAPELLSVYDNLLNEK